MSRKSLGMNSTLDLLVEMGEGNPGGLTVLASMIKENEDNLMCIMHLDDMNIRGSQIWVGYKDHCGENMETFIKCIRARDPEMIKPINNECYRPEFANDYEGYYEEAVTRGASWRDDVSGS